jgi:hypothetical protein
VPIRGAGRTDRELAELDVPALLRDGLTGGTESAGELFGDGAIAAAIAADRLSVQPRSLTFLAEIVRRGGVGYAAELSEPLPGADRTALARSWLVAVDAEHSDGFARWLDGVAVILGLRQHSTPPVT